MITLFSPMRPFRGEIAVVQRNAILSWLAAGSKCDVILIDDEEGTTPDAVADLDVEVVREVKRSRLGAPLLGDLLKVGAQARANPIQAYNTADVILPPNFADVALACHEAMGGKPYLAVAGRVDLQVPEHFDFNRSDWFAQVEDAVARHGEPHGHTAVDLWVYPTSPGIEAPPFPIGRHGTDGWVIYHMRTSGVPVIDLTEELLLVHQAHPRPAKKDPLFYEEQLECVELFEGMAENAMTLLDADWVFKDGALHRPRGLRRIHAELSLFRPYRRLIGLRRKFRLPHLFRVPVGARLGNL